MNKKYQCPCCRNWTLDEKPPGTYKICPVCAWEDDIMQFDNPGNENGANRVSLNQARANYHLFGVSDKAFLNLVRKPLVSEKEN
jgi:hypothetical protein